MLFDDENVDATNGQSEESYELDGLLGLSELPLHFPAHVEGFDGECFEYSVYFTKTPGEAEREAVEQAIEAYDFQLTGDDYIGYTNVSLHDGKVHIYLDLGNTEPENENKIIHGILLALNDLTGIQRVILNEGCGMF